MKIFLVNPPRYENMTVCRITRCEDIVRESIITPFDLLIMAKILEIKGHNVHFVDANAEKIKYPELTSFFKKIKPDITIFHASQECFLHDMETGRLAKMYGKSIALNWAFKTMAEEVYKDISSMVDCFVVNHNYLTMIPDYIENLPQIMDADEKMVFDKTPLPDWSKILDFKKYFTRVPSISPYAVTAGSWGCPFHCRFCSYRETGFNMRTPEHVVDEMEILSKKHGVKYIHFYDATFNVSEKRVYEICDEILERNLKVKWFINARADNWSYELAEKCKESGLDGISFGIESFTQEILDECKKNVTVEQNVKAVEDTKKAGIKTNLSLMIGLPSQSEKDIENTIKFLKKLKPNGFFISPYGMCALPNTYWFEKDREHGREFGTWKTMHEWGKWHSFCKYSPEQLQKIRKKIYRRVIWSIPYISGNVSWLLKHPRDLKIGLEFFGSTVTKFMRDWRYHR